MGSFCAGEEKCCAVLRGVAPRSRRSGNALARRARAEGGGFVLRRRLGVVRVGAGPSPRPSPTAVPRAGEGTVWAVLGEGVGGCARMVPPLDGVVVRGRVVFVEGFGVCEAWWGFLLRGGSLRAARHARAPRGGHLVRGAVVAADSIIGGRTFAIF